MRLAADDNRDNGYDDDGSDWLINHGVITDNVELFAVVAVLTRNRCMLQSTKYSSEINLQRSHGNTVELLEPLYVIAIH